MKKVSDVKSHFKTYYQHTHLEFIENSGILEEQLRNSKLHLNKYKNSVSANNFIKHLRSSFLLLDDFSCARNFQTEYGSQYLLASGKSVLTNNISEKSFRVLNKKI